MSLIESIIDKARLKNRTIVLAEGEEERIQKAALKIQEAKIAKIILIGDKAKIEQAIGVDNPDIQVIDPKVSEYSKEFINKLYELRKEKGMTEEMAENLILNNVLYFAAMMVKTDRADGMVGGAVHSTGDLLRPALQIIKTLPGIKTVSSVFLMDFEGTYYKDQKVMVFGDCAVNILPTAEQLKDIALASNQTAKSLASIAVPRIAMLSFSTKGSAKHENVDKVRIATELVKEQDRDIIIDGEIQVDAALVSSVAKLKAPGSALEAKANVLIFPDLQAGNIGYKLVQRLSGAQAIGPICQGFAKPVNDLSRGCSVDDVVAVVAITALQGE